MGEGENPSPFLFIMSELAIMAIISVVGSIISSYAASQQQKKEFGQQQLLQEDAQQFQSEREDLMFQRNTIPEQYQQMLDSGFNPILAAASIMGGNGVSAASSGSSPSAPTTNSAIGALSSMLGQGGQNLYDMFKQNAEIRNIEANTNKTDIEAGILPRDFELRSLSTSEQLRVWSASVERTKAAQHLDEAQTKLINSQNLYYGRMAQSQIDAYNATVAEKYANASRQLEAINTEKSQQAVNYSQVGVNVEQAAELRQRTLLEGEEASKTYYEAERVRIAKEFEQSLGNIPLTVDGQKYVQKLANDGDIDGINVFYQNIFSTALNQQAGKEMGTMPKAGFPFGILSDVPLKGYQGDLHRNNYKLPFWNPYLQ